MDATKGREALAYAIFRAAGVPAPRTAFAEVTITVPGRYDKEYMGLYIVVEQVNKNFLKDRYKTDAGLLMKPERVGSLAYLGEDWERYKTTYQPKRDATKDEIKRVLDFLKLVNQGTEAQFNKEIGSYLDIDAFLRFMAATALTSNLDSFFTIGHNYYLYLHPETKKFHFIPWDVDLALGNFAFFGSADQQMDLSLTKPYGGQCRLADRLMANKEVADKYQAVLKELATSVFTKERLLKEIAEIEKTTKNLIEKDRKAAAGRKEGGGGFGPPGGMGGPPGGFGRQSPDLRTFVEKRTESVAAQLAGKSTGFVPVGGFGGKGPGLARPIPGEILSQAVRDQLRLTEAQRKELADLQKDVDARLEKILTEEQRAQLKRMREGPGGGFGPPPGPAGPPGVAPPPRPKDPPQP
jgi:hypothetical protein